MPTHDTFPITKTERIETVVIGGGQAGLAVGHHLRRLDRPFVILDAAERTGDSWRNRWDSLVLFTPARYNGLPGMRFPAPSNSFVTKDQMADFLEEYARHFELPIRRRTRVNRLTRRGQNYAVHTDDTIYEVDNIVVAMANYQKSRIPGFSSELDARVVQLHASEYKGPDQVAPGSVLIVGLGNSGADIGLELARTHHTYVSGVETATVPFRIESFLGNRIGIRMVRFLGQYVLNGSTPIGRTAKQKLLRKAGPLVRVKPQDLTAAGVERVGRIVDVQDGRPRTQDGSILDVDNVIWCTGYRPGFEWIQLPALDSETGYPRHERGVAIDHPGLFFVGLHFLHAATSATVTGVSRDAKHVTRPLDTRMRALGKRTSHALQPEQV